MKKVRFGRTDMMVTRLTLGGYPFAGVNRAQGWDPYTQEGRREAVKTINTALDGGINYVDTAPSYGAGHSEGIFGDVLKTRRGDCFVATKVGFRLTYDEVIKSCEDSLKRLNTDYVDVLQFHGGQFTQEEVDHILRGGPADAMLKLRERGLIRFIGFTVEEPWTGRPLVRSGLFDSVQVCYNIVRQNANFHLLDDARKADMGVCCMRPMTSGIFQRQLESIAPNWLVNGEAYRVCMAFLLSDSRVHHIPVGMRLSKEVEENIAFVESFAPSCDIAAIPRLTQTIYESDDERNGI